MLILFPRACRKTRDLTCPGKFQPVVPLPVPRQNAPHVGTFDDARIEIESSPIPSLHFHARSESKHTETIAGDIGKFFPCV